MGPHGPALRDQAETRTAVPQEHSRSGRRGTFKGPTPHEPVHSSRQASLSLAADHVQAEAGSEALGSRVLIPSVGARTHTDELKCKCCSLEQRVGTAARRIIPCHKPPPLRPRIPHLSRGYRRHHRLPPCTGHGTHWSPVPVHTVPTQLL